MIWLWLGAVGLLFGAELNAQYERRRGVVAASSRLP
jgi:uncharacterized BrkB/YihY/UPF0761 family membrane protein